MGKETPQASYLLVSAYNTRARTHRYSKSELCYDQVGNESSIWFVITNVIQRYHPMDEYMQPKRAAKVRVSRGENMVTSDDESVTSGFKENNHAKSDSEDDELNIRAKRRKILPSQEIRRSSRLVNRDVLYDIKIHPQDVEIKMLEASEARVSKHDHSRNHPDDVSADEGSGNESDDEQEIEIGDGANDINHIIRDAHGIDSKDSLSTSHKLSPLSSTARDRSLASDSGTRCKKLQLYPIDLGRFSFPRPNESSGSGPSFHIHTESLYAQLHAENLARPPVNFDHDDKENNVTNPDLEPTPDPHDSIHVHTASEYRRHAEHEGDSDITPNEFEELIESFDQRPPSYMPDTDGTVDNYDDDVLEMKAELDSVFGNMSSEDYVAEGNHEPCRGPCRDGDCDSVLGFPFSADSCNGKYRLTNTKSPFIAGIEEAIATK
jgi:hypothetical protein